MKRKECAVSDDSAACTNDDGILNRAHSSSDSSKVQSRDITQLYASSITIDCALRGGCVPCAYKVGNFDVALDKEFSRQVPNQRPEQCPRSSEGSARDSTLGFNEGMSVLTVGDGDFTFSLAVARLLGNKQCQQSLVVTSYEDKKTLLRIYPGFDSTVGELESLGAKVFFNVDATSLEKTCPFLKFKKFHRICWNFPCTAIAKGQDGQNVEMEENKELVRRFVQNARTFLIPGSGEIVICHKTKPPFNHWRLEHVALEKVKDAVPSLEYAGRVVLDRFLLPPYTPRKALDRKSFPCHDACFYIFRLRKDSDSDNQSEYPPTIGPHSEIVAVTEDIIQSIRSAMLKRMRSVESKQRKKGKHRR